MQQCGMAKQVTTVVRDKKCGLTKLSNSCLVFHTRSRSMIPVVYLDVYTCGELLEQIDSVGLAPNRVGGMEHIQQLFR